MNILWVRILIGIVSVSSLFGIYYYWKDDIEDTLLAKLRLQAMEQAMVVQVEERRKQDEVAIQLKTDVEGYRLLSESLGEQIRRQLDENSCLIKPLSPNDIGVLNGAFRSSDKSSERPKGNDPASN